MTDPPRRQHPILNGGHRAATGKGSQIIGADPCHACGCGNADYTNWNNKGEWTAVRCEGCGALTPDMPTLSEAVESWNRGELTERRAFH